MLTPSSMAMAQVSEGMVIIRILDGRVKNKYANDPGKLTGANYKEKLTL